MPLSEGSDPGPRGYDTQTNPGLGLWWDPAILAWGFGVSINIMCPLWDSERDPRVWGRLKSHTVPFLTSPEKKQASLLGFCRPYYLRTFIIFLCLEWKSEEGEKVVEWDYKITWRKEIWHEMGSKPLKCTFPLAIPFLKLSYEIANMCRQRSVHPPALKLIRENQQTLQTTIRDC